MKSIDFIKSVSLLKKEDYMSTEHYRKLEKMYLKANIQKHLFETSTIKVEEAKASISIDIDERYYHGLQAVHGAIYFKLLDDACFFAVNSK